MNVVRKLFETDDLTNRSSLEYDAQMRSLEQSWSKPDIRPSFPSKWMFELQDVCRKVKLHEYLTLNMGYLNWIQSLLILIGLQLNETWISISHKQTNKRYDSQWTLNLRWLWQKRILRFDDPQQSTLIMNWLWYEYSNKVIHLLYFDFIIGLIQECCWGGWRVGAVLRDNFQWSKENNNLFEIDAKICKLNIS